MMSLCSCPIRIRAGWMLLTALMALLAAGCFHGHPSQPGAKLLDEKVITDRVQAALSAHQGYNFPGVRISTSAGVVTLRGQVETTQQKLEAVQLARSVDDVKEIRDRLQVRPGGPPPATPRL